MTDQQQNLLNILTASKCCICGKKLTDAESVERGIGPVCSRKFYEIQHEITLAMIAESKWKMLEHDRDVPPAIFEEFDKKVESKPREAVNLLVKYFSSIVGTHDGRMKIVNLSSVVQALGFTELALKLQEDRTSVFVTNPDRRGDVTLYMPKKMVSRTLRRLLMSLPQATSVKAVSTGPKRTRNREAFTFKGVHICIAMRITALLWDKWGVQHLSFESGAVLLDGDRRTVKEIEKEIHKVRVEFGLEEAKPKVVSPVLIVAQPKSFQIFSPYNAGFKDDLKEAFARKERFWNGVSKCWEVWRTPHNMTRLRNLVQQHYGCQPKVEW